MAAYMPMARNYYSHYYYDPETKEFVDNPSSEFANF